MDQLSDITKYSVKAATNAMSSLGSLSGLVADIPKAFFKTSAPVVTTPPPPPTPVIKTGMMQLAALVGNTSPWIRMAGLSGALAVSLGAYGAHGLNVPDERKSAFVQANKYHFIHTLAMLAVPMTHYPNLTGSLLVLGTLVFSGTCYCHAISGDKRVVRLTPYGGMTLIFAWISMML